MAVGQCGWVLAGMLVAATAARGEAAGPQTLREEYAPGKNLARVTVQWQATGQNRVGAKTPKPVVLPVKLDAHFEYFEKTLSLRQSDHQPARAIRYYVRAGAAIQNGSAQFNPKLRDAVRLVVAERRGPGLFLFSPSGPLTPGELELIRLPGDSLTLGTLLPTAAVDPGATWPASEAAALALSGLDSVSQNTVSCTLERLDAAQARIGVKGRIVGRAADAKAVLELDGHLVLDRKLGRVVRLELSQKDHQDEGVIGPEFTAHGKLTVTVAPVTLEAMKADGAPDFSPPAVRRMALKASPELEALVYESPEGYRLTFDRTWHIYQAGAKLAILRCIETAEWLAQCNISTATPAPAGSHISGDVFRAGVKRALGNQFERFIDSREIPTTDGRWIDRVAASGTAGAKGDRPVVWYYYMVAAPSGTQVVLSFALDQKYVAQFGDRDQAMAQSVEFTAAPDQPAKTAARVTGGG